MSYDCLTPEQQETVDVLMMGAKNKDIAGICEIGEKTVHQRLSGIYRAYGISTELWEGRVRLAYLRARELGLLVVCLFLAMSCHASVAGFTLLKHVTAASYTDTTCPLQSTCYYVVTAVDSTGIESPNATCSATQLCVGGNQAMAGMPTSGTHKVVLKWTGSGPAYNVYRHIGGL